MADRREWPSVHGRGALSFTERLLCAPFSPSSDGATAADASQCCSMPIRRANETARRWPRVLPVSGRAKDCSIDTYREHLRSFEREFPGMPEELAPIMGYLEQFGGETGRTKRNRQDTLNMLYKHAVQFFAMVKNPMLGLERPLVTKKRIRTLSLDQVPSMIRAPETPVERIALDMLLGHGWRQVEARRILVGDVDEIEDGLIWCRGKDAMNRLRSCLRPKRGSGRWPRAASRRSGCSCRIRREAAAGNRWVKTVCRNWSAGSTPGPESRA